MSGYMAVAVPISLYLYKLLKGRQGVTQREASVKVAPSESPVTVAPGESPVTVAPGESPVTVELGPREGQHHIVLYYRCATTLDSLLPGTIARYRLSSHLLLAQATRFHPLPRYCLIEDPAALRDWCVPTHTRACACDDN
jgi:hypothetical protein